MGMVGITERGDAGLQLHEWIDASKKYKLDFVIAITKSPSILLRNINILPPNLIIHSTITGYGGSWVEPNVHSRHEELNAYDKLVDILGPDRVVLRIDPIHPTPRGIEISKEVATRCRGRLRISILDYYKHVKDRFKYLNIDAYNTLNNLYNNDIHLAQHLRRDIIAQFPSFAEICGEPDFPSTGCVSVADYKALGLPVPLETISNKQRPSCACLSNKKELLINKKQCNHMCVYCYWK